MVDYRLEGNVTYLGVKKNPMAVLHHLRKKTTPENTLDALISSLRLEPYTDILKNSYNIYFFASDDSKDVYLNLYKPINHSFTSYVYPIQNEIDILNRLGKKVIIIYQQSQS